MNDSARGAPAEPQHECDLVMKGGVTSGLVYPPAVLELSRQYRIRNIGGTSAGAVAAALTAAAEYGRATGGYGRLADVARQLQQPGYLRNLFQGSRRTEPLLQLVISAPRHVSALQNAVTGLRGSRIRLAQYVGRWLARVASESGVRPSAAAERVGAAIGIAAGLAAAALVYGIASLFGDPPLLLFGALAFVAALVLHAAGSQIAAVASGWRELYRLAFEEVPGNLFGICSGLRDPANERYQQVAATEWLRDSVEAICGPRGDGAPPCLTFGELKRRTKPITLQFVTTDVSDGRPYVLPFDEPFIFRRSEFLKLFPAEVVDELSRHAREERDIRLPPAAGAASDYAFLPAPDKWPVVVAARMSMSFPMFFSSAPLYQLPHVLHEAVRRRRSALRRAAAGSEPPSLHDDPVLATELASAEEIRRKAGAFVIAEDQLVPHWFSDGGIASNFPIHFFDGWLPARPTFGITLRYLSADLLKEEQATQQKRRAQSAYAAALGDRATASQALVHGADEGDVWLPRAQDSVPADWHAIHHPGCEVEAGATWRFLWAIIGTMQNYRDNTQAALASYRERIVQVRLRPDEGGFNLEMPPAVVQGVIKKGERAGGLLSNVFRLEHHQWVRLRMLLSRMERAFEGFEPNAAEAAKKLIQTQRANAEYPFRELDDTWCADLCNRAEALLKLPTDSWKGSLERFESESTLRVTPHP